MQEREFEFTALLEKRSKLAAYRAEVESDCCEQVPRHLKDAELRRLNEEIAIVDQRLALLNRSLEKDLAPAPQPNGSARIIWRGTQREFAKGIVSFYSSQQIQASSQTDAL